MKTMILTTLMMLTGATAYAGGYCEGSNTIRELSTAAAEINSNSKKHPGRIPIDRTSKEFKMLNAIGVISREDGGIYDGTGFLVDECHVLTNNHVAFKEDKGQQPKKSKIGTKLLFSVGQGGSKAHPFIHPNIEGTVIAYENYDHTLATGNKDWVVIRLSKPVGKEVGYIPQYAMSAKQMVTQSILTAGFPGDKTQNGDDLSNLFADPMCKILGMGAYGYILHTCQVTGGQSGSPLLAKGNDEKYYAVGMVSGDNDSNGLDRNNDPNKANTAVSFDSGKSLRIVSEGDKIQAAINADPCK